MTLLLTGHISFLLVPTSLIMHIFRWKYCDRTMKIQAWTIQDRIMTDENKRVWKRREWKMMDVTVSWGDDGGELCIV